MKLTHGKAKFSEKSSEDCSWFSLWFGWGEVKKLTKWCQEINQSNKKEVTKQRMWHPCPNYIDSTISINLISINDWTRSSIKIYRQDTNQSDVS